MGDVDERQLLYSSHMASEECGSTSGEGGFSSHDGRGSGRKGAAEVVVRYHIQPIGLLSPKLAYNLVQFLRRAQKSHLTNIISECASYVLCFVGEGTPEFITSAFCGGVRFV